MPASATQIFILFLLIAAGFTAGKIGTLDEPTGKKLSRLLVDFIWPCLIIVSMQKPLTPELRTEAFMVLGISFTVYAAAFPLAFVLVRALGLSGPAAGVHAFAAVFANVVFMGLPVLEALFGKSILFTASIYNIPFQLLSFSVGAAMIAGRTEGGTAGGVRREAKLSLKSFVTPAGLASFLGLGLFLLGISIPAPLFKAASLLGDCTTPLSMVLIGGALCRADLRSALADWRLYASSAYRLLLFPLAVWLVLRALGLTGTLLGLPVIMAAMPAAANSSILAEAYGGDYRTASTLVAFTTAVSLITIPLLATILFGI
jgi:hypothetical protein